MKRTNIVKARSLGLLAALLLMLLLPVSLTYATNLPFPTDYTGGSLDVFSTYATESGVEIETHANIPNTFCNTVSQIPQTECQALIALYNSTNGDNWSNNSGWGQTNTPCTWHGVGCGRADIRELNLSSNQLSGSIPSELGQLTNLTSLRLSSNQLSGSIPSELGNLANLTQLWLLNNQLSGSIPPQLGQLANLTDLYLSSNQLSGSIPPELSQLANLWYLRLDSNQLSGSIPPQLGQLANLTDLYLSSNQLSGSIPPELSQLANLTILDLDNNRLSGRIPPELGQLANLGYLRLHSNQLSDSIPPELGQLANLGYLRLHSNQLSGSIPLSFMNLNHLYGFDFDDTNLCEPPDQGFQEWLDGVQSVRSTNVTCSGTICDSVSEIPQTECQALIALYNSTNGDNWSNNSDWGQTNTPCSWRSVGCSGGHITELYLHDNQLEGSIPSELGNLTNLTHLRLSSNQLSGPIPSQLGNLVNLTSLRLYNNQLSGSIPPQLGNLTKLTELSLYNNYLSDSIPPELGNLYNLTTLKLFLNGISGSIPSQLGNLTKLSTLNLRSNQLEGNIPPELGNLANLKYLYLSNNQLSGSIPLSFMNLNSLYGFDFDDTNLCEPGDQGFQEWLDGVQSVGSTNVTCPILSELSPNRAVANGGEMPVVISGEQLQEPVTAQIGGVELLRVTLQSRTVVHAVVPVDSLSKGVHDLTVESAGYPLTLTNAFTVTNVTLLCSIELQDRPSKPHPRWVVPLNVSLTIPGEQTPAHEFTPTTDENGHFTISGIIPGTYELRLKHSHTLQNKLDVTLVDGENNLDCGTLREGDANNDNLVNDPDFEILAATFGKCEGTPEYDGRADFNADACVTLDDFSLLAANFGQGGE